MSQSDSTGFQTQRSKLLAQYDSSGQPYVAKTKPYYSTAQFILQVADALPVSGSTMAHAILRAGQVIQFFAYRLGDSIPFGPPGTSRNALESDTNLSKPRQTNGVEDFVIEGLSMTCKGLRLDYASSAYTGTDSDAKNAYLGKAAIYDPAALGSPPQMMSPFNLENAIWEACKVAINVELEWDRARVEKLFRADALVEGGGKSYLKASGEPSTNNRVRIPEGYLWRREGMPDSELIVRATVQEAVVIPITLVGIGTQSSVSIPNNLYLDVTVRLHGLALSVPSQN